MESAVGAASWLLGKALTKLSDELVAAFVASSELGHNFQSIKQRLLLTQGLLHAAGDRDVSNDPGLYGLLGELSKKADEAEDALDEIHYFMIQDQLDGTTEAVVQEPAAPQVGDVIRGHARDGRHAIRHTMGAMDGEQDNMSIAGDLLLEIAMSKLMHADSFQLEELVVDSISAVLTPPICCHLAASLHTLMFSHDQQVRTFTEEQEQALQLLSSLHHLEIHHCNNLQSLPQGLRGLSYLKRLVISSCEKIKCLPPKEGLPASLEYLAVWCLSPEVKEQARKLKKSDPWFTVEGSWPRN